MAELGQTTDPKALIPGDAATISRTQAALQAYGDLLHMAGEGLKRIDTTDGWSGDAADAFRKVFHGQPGKWLDAGDAFHDAAAALGSYLPTLTWAQGQAAEAINTWASGDAHHQAAQDQLNSARSQLDGAGHAADAAVGKARDKAPKKPGFWSQLGDDIGGFLSDAGHFAENVGETALDDLASVGNAMLHDPGSMADMAGGLVLATLGAGGEVAGAALDVTGIGSVLGVPAAVVSAGAIASGLSLMGLGASNIMQDAAGSDRVNMSSNNGGGGGGSNGPVNGPGHTQPSGAADPTATPDGHVTNIPKKADPETVRALSRENESADILAKNGYKVEQNPNVPGAKNPDYKVEGQVFDCYSPTTDKPRAISDAIEKKVAKGQADRIVLNLSDSDVDPAALNAQLHDYPVPGLQEVTVIDKAGNVLHFYP